MNLSYKIITAITCMILGTGVSNFCKAFSPINVENYVSALSPKKTIKVEKKWLLLPVKNGAERKRLNIFVDGEKVRWIDIEFAEENPDWYAYLDISEWEGKTLELVVNGLTEDAKEFALIKQSNKELDKNKLYDESMRGQIHFSPKRGWNNDPNGLVYYKGRYHLFFQHNPYGSEWGNMHWGHAVSKDLVHWEEVGEALYPDAYGPVFSGSGVVDKNNTSGFGTQENPPMVVTFTSSDAWIQGIAYSNDGEKFTRMDHPAVEKITDGNRDPKIIWYAPEKKWIMVLWVEKENKLNTIHFFSSKNLKDWKLTSVLEGGKEDDRYLFECPDLYELPVQGEPGEKRWVLNAANGQYAIGTFDGETFHPEETRLKSVQTEDYYAAQTFTNDPKGRKVEIGWFRTKTNSEPGNNFNQSMSIPTKLELLQTPEGLRLSRTPIEEMKKLRGKHHNLKDISVDSVQTDLDIKTDKPLELIADINLKTSRSITLGIRGVKINYDSTRKQLNVNGKSAPLVSNKGVLHLRIFVDRTGLEIFADNGIFYIPVSVNIPQNNKDISFKSDAGITVSKLDIFELDSIWK